MGLSRGHARGVGDGLGRRRPQSGYQPRRAVGAAAVVAVAVACGVVALLVPTTGSAVTVGARATPASKALSPMSARQRLLVERHRGGPTTTTPTAPPTTTTTPTAPPTTTTTTTTTPPTTTTTTTAPPTTTTTTTTAPGAVQPVGQDAGPWNLIFDSEFNGSSLDTSQWSTGWFGAGITTGASSSEQECYDPSQVSVTNGALDLSAVARAETCGGTTQPYASGMVTTDGKFSFTYGYMEARIWLPGTSSIDDWPAFWADGQNWPTTGEIDTVEGLGGQACAHFHNPAGGPGTCATGNYAGGWHTFAADWEPGSVTYYYDGAQVWTDTSGITSAPMYLILDLALSSTITSPDTAPAAMQVEYVRVWQH